MRTRLDWEAEVEERFDYGNSVNGTTFVRLFLAGHEVFTYTTDEWMNGEEDAIEEAIRAFTHGMHLDNVDHADGVSTLRARVKRAGFR